MPKPLTKRQYQLFALGYFTVWAFRVARWFTHPFPEPYDSVFGAADFIANLGLIVVLYRTYRQVWAPNAS